MLQLLWGVAKSVARNGEDPGEVFAPIGLFLDPVGRPDECGYDATPAGATTFASTGGDGVHFSFVPTRDTSAIVMTVPMMFDRPNVVVGRDLIDFLSLGCHYGYFALEQLAYAPGATIAAIESAVDDGERLLTTLRRHLRLTPWTAVGDRFDELAALTPAPRR